MKKNIITFQPVIFEAESKKEKLVKNVTYIDAFERQMKELYFIDNVQFIGSDRDTVFKSSHFEEFTKRKKHVYVYYPWTKTLVKTVCAEDYFKLITNRNRDLVTSEEQSRLYNYKVAIFGMSVGSNIAFTLVQSGISKEITIADYDELDSTNLNRLSGGLHQIGINKSYVASRRIYENNPFAKVNVLDKGISVEVLEKMIKEKQIDCIFEEIDNLGLKLEIRKICLKYKIPVLMVTDNSDGVVLHVERYDKAYKDFFGYSAEYWQKRISEIKSVADIGDIILNDIIGGPNHAHPRVISSVEKVLQRQLISWSQLGTAAILGGVVGTIAVKQIVAGDQRKYYRDIIKLDI